MNLFTWFSSYKNAHDIWRNFLGNRQRQFCKYVSTNLMNHISQWASPLKQAKK